MTKSTKEIWKDPKNRRIFLMLGIFIIGGFTGVWVERSSYEREVAEKVLNGMEMAGKGQDNRRLKSFLEDINSKLKEYEFGLEASNKKIDELLIGLEESKKIETREVLEIYSLLLRAQKNSPEVFEILKVIASMPEGQKALRTVMPHADSQIGRAFKTQEEKEAEIISKGPFKDDPFFKKKGQ